ncbi:hypothetical protein E1286_38820 [Nonomuraea terrae]|uniref:SnoaL-like domain-containing protein n=1 Tax=Nonomuraea terrae TaxID=2530383 RepID=A0A4R4XYJ0_9ACTN|nr:nuclear transport factor 2 family protein [Nonomuraea terrae]TDD36119.1 hypothetical protein E1286_38820 [Nonomuraea terrae]
MDEARFDDLHTVFTPDATVRTAGSLAQGRDAVIAQATRTHATERHASSKKKTIKNPESKRQPADT